MCSFFWFVIVSAHLASVVLATPLDPVPIGRGFALNEFVRHWEAARYDQRGSLGARGGRARRGAAAPAPGPLRLSFKAHNREFHLRLRPDPSSVFADGAEFHGTRGPVEFHTGSVYSGTLEDDELSSVYGIITSEGLFDGTISTRNEDYYIEPLYRYGKTHPQIHSVIYKTSDVIHPSEQRNHPCSSHLLFLSQLKDTLLGNQTGEPQHNQMINQGTFVKYNSDIDSEVDSLQKLERSKRWLPDDEIDVFRLSDLSYDDSVADEATPLRNPSLPIDLYVPYYSENEDSNTQSSNLNRIRNGTDKTRGILINNYDEDGYGDGNIFSRPNSKNHVEIKSKINVVDNVIRKKPVGFTVISSLTGNVTDSLLRHVNKRATVDPKKTTCMLYLQADHQFYQKFGSEEACIEVMTRHVQRVNTIYKVTDFNQDGKPDNITFMIKRIKVHTMDALKDPLYRFPNNYGVEKFLELFSEEDYDGFCLAYMFTYRDFEMGTLGLAWTGDLKNAGGVCEKNGHYRGSLKSLNTGIVTLLNYGKHVPPAVSHVTLAHEIGHNFGSPHDPDVCTPGGEDGNFIMFARATSGDKKNNNHFSPCSLKSINPVLNNKARSSKGCFTEPQVSLCGNGVVEAGEECDCGWEGDCREPCCYPQRRHPPPGETPCRLTPTSICSPSQGPCCTPQCSLRFGEQCRSDNGCRDSSHCDGRRPHCPASASKPNRTVCDDGFVCYMGECTGSICLAYGLESCQCASDRACDLCCKMPGAGNPCRSSFQWNHPPYDVPDLFAKPGTPCNDYNGYCDVFQKCREVDPSGPLATLRKLLLSEESLSSFKKWILDHWYAVALIILAVIGILVGSTRLLSKKSDGKLKSVTIMHSSTTETVRLPEHCPDGVIVHTAVRSKVPLKKKVALKSRAHRKTKEKSREPEHSAKIKKRTLGADDLHKHIKEPTTSQIEAVAIKLRKAGISKNKIAIAKRKGKKEVIDYSAAQKDRDQTVTAGIPVVAESDSMGKVQNWLLSSPQPTVITKSKSTPAGLVERDHSNKTSNPPTKPPRGRYEKNNSKSVNNLNQGEKEKVRLQVIYKPPFKFSLKLCKSDRTRVVVDKTTPTRNERGKKKTHLRIIDNNLSRSNKISSSPVAGPSVENPDGPISRLSVSSNGATAGLNPTNESVAYEEVADNNEHFKTHNEQRLSQYQKEGTKRTHKKSNSVGQGSRLAESRQNLLLQDQWAEGGDAHFYENMMFGTSDSKSNLPNKSSSMPRNISPRHVSRTVSRQNSHNITPPPRTGSSQRANRRLQNGSINRNIKKSFSNASQHIAGHPLQKGSSLNNLPSASRKNSVSDKKRHSIEPSYGNTDPRFRQSGFDDKHRKAARAHPSDVGYLKRQLSATELYRSPAPTDFFMPLSAGAKDCRRPDFDWTRSENKSADNGAPPSLSDSRTGSDCTESRVVPNIADSQMPLVHNLENKRPLRRKVHPGAGVSSAHKRQRAVPDDAPVCSFPEARQTSDDSRPHKFADFKNTLPDGSRITDPPDYRSDMEVLVSDNDYSLFDV